MKVRFEDIGRVLSETDPARKCAAAIALDERARTHGIETPGHADHFAAAPGRPPRPVLVEPRAVPRRRLGSTAGRAALVHAIAHIEFNAINLALDAAWRFSGMPHEFRLDWVSVAADEARHFTQVNDRLRQLGHRYGDFPAHNGLWEMAEKTAGSCLERMALVPRVLEARGLDVTPGMIERLQRAGDAATAAVLVVILEEEVRHVEIGSRWFAWCCKRAGLRPGPTFIALLNRHYRGRLKGPFNMADRTRAGFSPGELEALQSL